MEKLFSSFIILSESSSQEIYLNNERKSWLMQKLKSDSFIFENHDPAELDGCWSFMKTRSISSIDSQFIITWSHCNFAPYRCDVSNRSVICWQNVLIGVCNRSLKRNEFCWLANLIEVHKKEGVEGCTI